MWKMLAGAEQCPRQAARHCYSLTSYRSENKLLLHPQRWNQTSIRARAAKCFRMECRHGQRNKMHGLSILCTEISKCTGTRALSKHFWTPAGLCKSCIYIRNRYWPGPDRTPCSSTCQPGWELQAAPQGPAGGQLPELRLRQKRLPLTFPSLPQNMRLGQKGARSRKVSNTVIQCSKAI